MPNVELNGIKLEYIEQGQGKPMLFVHGGSGDFGVWKNQLNFFSSKYHAIAVSCRGYYPNKKLEANESITLNTFVEDLAAFVRALNLTPVHLAGHSSPGGFGSLLLALKYPDLLSSVILIEPPAFPVLGINIPPKPAQMFKLLLSNPGVAIGFMKFGAKAMGPAIKAFDRGDDEEGLRIFMKANLGNEAFNSLPASRFQRALENIGPLKAQIKAGFPVFSEQDVQSIKLPALLVSGEKSNVVLRGVTDKLQKLLPNVERLNIKNASHNMFETNPDVFNSGVMNFLENLKE
jgi:pimeloyl-ACP methyl ester carboxylesterase